MRKIEASLLGSGFEEDEVAVVHPDYLDDFVGPRTRVVGVAAMDPLGLGPVSHSLGSIVGGQPATALEFRRETNQSVRPHRVGDGGDVPLVTPRQRTGFPCAQVTSL